jgi:hypothetical protein
MLALVLAALVAQARGPAPQLAVVVSGRNGMTEARAESLAMKLTDMLTAAGIAVAMDPKEAAQRLSSSGLKSAADCEGKRACVSGLGRVLKVWGVLGVDLADLDGTVAAHLELVDSDSGERLAQHDAVATSKKIEGELQQQLKPFLPALKQALERAATAPQNEAPPVSPPAPPPAALVPEPRPPEPPEPAVTSSGPSRVPAVLSFGLAAAAIGAAVVFAVLATQARRDFDDHARLTAAGDPAYDLTRTEAQARVNGINRDWWLTGAFGGVGGALILTGALLLGVSSR